jgi:hypothetical protein
VKSEPKYYHQGDTFRGVKHSSSTAFLTCITAFVFLPSLVGCATATTQIPVPIQVPLTIKGAVAVAMKTKKLTASGLSSQASVQVFAQIMPDGTVSTYETKKILKVKGTKNGALIQEYDVYDHWLYIDDLISTKVNTNAVTFEGETDKNILVFGDGTLFDTKTLESKKISENFTDIRVHSVSGHFVVFSGNAGSGNIVQLINLDTNKRFNVSCGYFAIMVSASKVVMPNCGGPSSANAIFDTDLNSKVDADKSLFGIRESVVLDSGTLILASIFVQKNTSTGVFQGFEETVAKISADGKITRLIQEPLILGTTANNPSQSQLLLGNKNRLIVRETSKITVIDPNTIAAGNLRASATTSILDGLNVLSASIDSSGQIFYLAEDQSGKRESGILDVLGNKKPISDMDLNDLQSLR